MDGGAGDDMDFYWDACDRAMREEAIATGSDAADARRFRSSAFPPPEVDESLECVSVTLLPDGDLHVCFGMACPHARMDPRSRSWTCELTGHELGTSPAHEQPHKHGAVGRVCQPRRHLRRAARRLAAKKGPVVRVGARARPLVRNRRQRGRALRPDRGRVAPGDPPARGPTRTVQAWRAVRRRSRAGPAWACAAGSHARTRAHAADGRNRRPTPSTAR